MATALTLRGVYLPLITPFDERDRVDVDALERLAAGYLDAGARGLVALATTGEPTSLDDAERAAVVAACARVCADRGAELIVGAGTNDTRTTGARHEALADVPYARPSRRSSTTSMLGSDDPYLFPLTLMGATGAVAASAHLCTARFVDMIDAGLDGRVTEGRVTEGRRHAEALLPLVQALFSEPSPAVIKAVLHADGLIPTPDVRMPLANAGPEALAAALRARS